MALSVPKESLEGFPEAFRVGMATRSDKLRDYGVVDPKNWDQPFSTGQIHMQVSAFSDTEEKWHRAMEIARQQYQGFSAVTVLMIQDFGAQPGSLNPLGYKDGIGPTRHRGQRCRSTARSGATDQSR